MLAVPLALTLLACGERTRGIDSAGVDTARAEAPETLDFGSFHPRNLVVVNVDTLRADALPPWGSARNTLPQVGAQDGWVVIDRAVSTGSWTAPATASLLSGLDQPSHGVRAMSDGVRTGVLEAPTFAEHFLGLGYSTALFTGSEVVMDYTIGFHRGFEVNAGSYIEPGNASAVVNEAMYWLDTLPSDRPFFLFLQPVDPHGPYRASDADLGTWADTSALPFSLDATAPEQDAEIREAVDGAATEAERAAILEQVRLAYDEQILGVDRAVVALLDGLAARGRAGDTLVIFAADHGESFYDGPPEQLGHGVSVRQELVHVPLMFWGQGVTGGRVSCVASNMDVLPTALAAMGLPAMPDTEGRSLLDGCRDAAYSGVYEISATDGETLTWLSAQDNTAAVTRDCTTGEDEAFNLSADPHAVTAEGVDAVPGAAELALGLDDYAAAVTALHPDLGCARP